MGCRLREKLGFDRWMNEVDFCGKDVVVNGSGSSAAQVVPSLFKTPFAVKSVT